MIIYVDTSALVPLLIDEPTSAACGELWDGADSVASTRLTYVEAVAAVSLAQRIGRISAAQLSDCQGVLTELWPVVDVIELDQDLMFRAAQLATHHGLRGYDAVHCAAAIGINDADLVAASGDEHLLAAWQAEGVAVHNTHIT